jgi:hypothetical protein
MGTKVQSYEDFLSPYVICPVVISNSIYVASLESQVASFRVWF